MTIVMNEADDAALEQVIKQLYKQIDVLKVTDMTNQPVVARELALIQVNNPVQNRGVITSLIEPFRATILDVGKDTVTIQVTGKSDKVDALIGLLRPYGIKELARTGLTALMRDVAGVTEAKRVSEEHILTI